MKHIVALISALFLSIGLSLAAVNVNTATQAELQTLDGIGPVKAKAIIDHRTKNGPFKSIDDLEKVSGIGQSTLKDIRKDVTLTGATSTKAGAKGADKKDAKADAKADGTKDKAKSEMKKADTAADKSKAESKDAKSVKKDEKKDEKKAEKKAEASK